MSTLSSKNIQLKRSYVEYFQDVPIQKYAAMAIGKNEDTIIRWKKNDNNFADSIKKAKAIWVRKRVLDTKAEFALERLEASIFSRKNADLNLKVNMPAPLIYLPRELAYSSILERKGKTEKIIDL